MATDATGAPTTLGIPKFNTSADAPSGLGSNAQMDAIDALLAARVVKPAGIVTGESSVWNGSGWDRSSVTRLGVGSLGSGTPDSTKFLRGDGSWQVPTAAVVTYGTAFPGSPVGGDEHILVDNATTPVLYVWRFRYNAASANTDKWEFIGGADAVSEVTTAETIGTASSYVAVATAGPSFTVPRAGVYDVFLKVAVDIETSGSRALMSYDIGGTGAVDVDAVQSGHNSMAAGVNITTVSGGRRKSGLAASTALVAKYKSTLGTVSKVQDRVMQVRPVRLS